MDTTYTGLVKYNSKWVYVSKGKLDATYTGMVRYKDTWVYVKKGNLDNTYTGLAKNQYGWWHMTNGKLDLTYTGMSRNQYGWWYVSNGKLDTTYTGLAKNQYGWWHMTNGQLDTSHTGISSNKYGEWYVVNGRLDTSFSGEVKIGDVTYTIEGGKVISESADKTEGQIILGEYKGIKVDASLAEVSDEDIESYLESILESMAVQSEVTGVTFEEDDLAKLDFVCVIDGEEYESGTDVEIYLNEYGFNIDGFTDNIIGRKTGEVYEFTLQLGDDFYDEEMAGKYATFTVTLHSKIVTTIPEFTDEFVATNFDYMGLSTKEELLEYIEEDLRISNIYNDIWNNVVVETAEVKSYDSEELAALTEEYVEYMEYLISMYGYSMEEYLEAMEMTEEEFLSGIEEASKSQLERKMIIKAIAEEENIVVTEEIYQEIMLQFAKSYGFDSVDEFVDNYSSSMTREDFEYTILAYLVQKFVCESVEFVEGYGLRTEVY